MREHATQPLRGDNGTLSETPYDARCLLELFELIVFLLVAVLVSSVLDEVLPLFSLPLVQIALGAAVCCVTVAFCSNLLMVQDRVSGARRDLAVSPVRPSTIAVAYFCASALATLLISLTALAVCLLYLALTGWLLRAGDVLFMLLDAALLTLFGVALSSCVNFPLRTQGQGSAVGTIVSAGYGFLCGAYMPISNFSSGLQKVLSFLPGTYGTSLLRNHALAGAYREMARVGFPAEVIEAIRDSIDCNLYFFGRSVSIGGMYAVLVGATLLLVGLYVLLNAVRRERT